MTKICIISIILFSMLNSKCRTLKHNDCDKVYNNFKERLIKANKKDSITITSEIEFFVNEDFTECSKTKILLADTYFDLKEYSKALLHYRELFNQDSTDLISLYNTSLIYYNTNKYDSSIFFLKKILLSKSGEYFIIDYNDKLNIDKRNNVSLDEVKFMMGLCYYYMNQYKQALVEFNYCITNSQYKVAKSYLYRGKIYCLYKVYEKACKDFTLAINLGETNAEVNLNECCK